MYLWKNLVHALTYLWKRKLWPNLQIELIIWLMFLSVIIYNTLFAKQTKTYFGHRKCINKTYIRETRQYHLHTLIRLDFIDFGIKKKQGYFFSRLNVLLLLKVYNHIELEYGKIIDAFSRRNQRKMLLVNHIWLRRQFCTKVKCINEKIK